MTTAICGRSAAEVREHADPGAVEAELRAQIEAAKAAGISMTHLDCHMGAVFAPELIGIYRRLGQEEGVPVLYTRAWNGDAAKAFADRSAYEETERELEARGNPLFENGYETPWVASAESEAGLRPDAGPHRARPHLPEPAPEPSR